jgi:N-acetylneuraminic acid mutarotase
MDEEDMSDIDYHLEWRKVQTRSYLTPPLKANSACVRLGDSLYLFGGQGAGQFSEVWKFSGKQLAWQEVVCTSVQIGEIPSARDGHTMVKISETKVIIYAGQGGLFDSGKCERATEHGKVKYMSMRKLFDDMFELDVSTLQWTSKPRRKVRPLGRRGHTMIYLKPSLCKKTDDYGKGLGNLLLFGGSCLDTSTGFEKVSSDVWTYSLNDEQWTEVECGGVRPRAVYGHSGVLMEESYVIVGGSYAPPKKEGFLSKGKRMSSHDSRLVTTFN